MLHFSALLEQDDDPRYQRIAVLEMQLREARSASDAVLAKAFAQDDEEDGDWVALPSCVEVIRRKEGGDNFVSSADSFLSRKTTR